MRTKFTEYVGIEHPVVLAPMGGIAGGALAAAVAEGGGLGMIGGGRSELDWIEREWAIATERSSRPIGVGFQTWAVQQDVVEWVVDRAPAAVMLSFGDPHRFAARVTAAGVPLIVQVADLDQARRALDAGADVLVAQGAEAGGHSDGNRGTVSLVPAVVDIAGATPVLAAGGIGDGRGLAAALVLGAAGAVIGTRFQATPEALISPGTAKALLDGVGSDTERNRILDIARDAGWPRQYLARTLRNDFLDRWRDREAELTADPAAARIDYRADPAAAPIWAGEGLDFIDAIEPAAALVERLVAQAERALRGAIG